MNKKFWKKGVLMLLPLFAFTACNDGFEGGINGGEEGGGDITDDNGHGVVFEYPAYVGNIDNDVKEAVKEIFTNTVSVSDNPYVLILGSINELDAATLHSAYTNGATIGVVNPSKSELDAFVSQNDWIEDLDTDDTDGSFLFSFNNNDDLHLITFDRVTATDIVSEEDDWIDEDLPATDPALSDEDLDFVESPDEAGIHNDYCLKIAGWAFMLKMKLDAGDLDGAEQNDQKFFKGKSTKNMGFDFYEKRHIRTSGAYKDSCEGSGRFDIVYDYNMVHVYDGEEGAGDYYIMTMKANLNNSGMWNGNEKRKNHIGAVTKICGWLLDNFEVRTTLLDSLKKPVNVQFAPETEPLPHTETKSGKKEIGQSFSVTAGASVSGGWSKEKGLNAGGQASVQIGWSWSDKSTWDMNECSIGNLQESNKVGWRAQIDHFPTYTTTGKVTLPDNQLLKSTVYLPGTWIWKEESTPDNVRRGPYILQCDVVLRYFARSHVYSKTKDKHIEIKKTLYIEFPEAIETKTTGGIKLINDFDDKYIYDISVIDLKDNGKALTTETASHNHGDTIDFGYYFDKGKYSMTFKARSSGAEEPVTYSYSLHDSIPLTKGKVITLNAKNDFKAN